MTNIQTGNAEIDGASHRGWLVGNFIEEQLGLRRTDDVEIKWSVHKAGDTRDEWVTGETRTTICILISGTFTLEFRDQSVAHRTPGDYAMWGPGTDHKWSAPEDCICLTVRWPSIA